MEKTNKLRPNSLNGLLSARELKMNIEGYNSEFHYI